MTDDTVLVDLTHHTLDVQSLSEAVRSDADGAVVTFVGVVRDRSDDDRTVDGLVYEAYAAMALPEMRAICDEVRQRFPRARIALAHRIGRLAVGEASVAIAVATPHRADAFAACTYAIDELKRRVPIWKHERYAGGDASWRANAAEGA